MRHKTGCKFISFLITLLLVVGLMPGMSFTVKAESAYSALIPTDSDSAEVLASKVVHYNDSDWYIIEDDSDNLNGPSVTLFAKEPHYANPFQLSSDDTNHYSEASIITCMGWFINGGQFADVKDQIVTIPSLTTKGYNSDEIYDTATNVKFYLLSIEEAQKLPVAVRKCSKATDEKTTANQWWLRTPGKEINLAACVNGETGDIMKDGVSIRCVADETGIKEGWLGIRPAIRLDLTKVLFNSESNTFAEPTSCGVWVGGVEVTTANLKGQGWSYDPTEKILTLNNYNSREAYHFQYGIGESQYYSGIYSKDSLTIVLNGDNSIYVEAPLVHNSTMHSYGAGIYLNNSNADLTIKGSGTLSINSYIVGGYEAYSRSYGICASGKVIIEGGLISLQKGEKLDIYNGNYYFAIEAKNIDIQGGVLEAESNSRAIIGTISIAEGMCGLQSKDEITWSDVSTEVTDENKFAKFKSSQATPAAPKIKNVAIISVELEPIENGEYRHSGSNTWQDSPVFNDLDPDTSYTFYQRYKEDATHNFSPESVGVSAKTNPHNHELSYEVETDEGKSSIRVTCDNTDGGHKGDTSVALTLRRPTMEIIGDGGSEEAILEGLDAFKTATGENISDVPIRYYKAVKSNGIYVKTGGELEKAPDVAGDYIAEITVAGKNASVGYTLWKNYGIYVGETLVTGINANDILGDGSAVYNEAEGTLILNNYKGSSSAYSTDDYTADIYCNGNLDKLSVKLIGENVIPSANSDRTYGIYSEKKLEITGDGSLICSGEKHGIYCNELNVDGADVKASATLSGIKANKAITVQSGKVDASGKYGIICSAGDGTNGEVGSITIEDGEVKVEGTDIGIFGKVTVKDGVVTVKGTQCGVYGSVTIEGGELSAEAHNSDNKGYGISGEKVVEYDIKGGYVTVKGGKLNTQNSDLGIQGVLYSYGGTTTSAQIDGHVYVKDGDVNVSGEYGIKTQSRTISHTFADVNVDGGTLTSTGTKYGISGFVCVDYNGTLIASTTAFNGYCAIEGSITNSVQGIGWHRDGTKELIIRATDHSVQPCVKVQILPHFHEFTYEVGEGEKADTITATCKYSDCTLTEKPTVTIVKPTMKTYGQSGDGISAEASIIDKDDIRFSEKIRYFNTNDEGTGKTGDALPAAPTDAGKYWAEITFGTGNNAKTAHVIYTIAKADEDAPEANIDILNINYPDETISAKDGYEVASDKNGTEIKDLSSILDTDNPTVYVRKDASDENHNPSEWVAVTLKPRPDAPTGLTAENATDMTTADGKIKGTTTSMEYMVKGSTGGWTDISDSETSVRPGIYLVRYKADSDTPASKFVEVTVDSKKIILSDDQKPAKKAGIAYTGSDQLLLDEPSEELPSGATGILYALGTDDATAPREGWIEAIPSATNAGTYTVYYKVKSDDNHNDVDPEKITVTILPKTLTITVDAKSKEIGEEDPELTYTCEGLLEGDTITGELTRDKGETAGKYAITIGTITAGDNYKIDFKGADLTIIPDEPIIYTNTEGDGSDWTLGSEGTLTFRFSRSFDDADTINHFTGIKVDGEVVDKDDYTFRSGSVIIDLKAEYLSTLSVGKHTLTAMFDDSDDVTVEFLIKDKASSAADKEETATDNNNTPSSGRKSDASSGGKSTAAGKTNGPTTGDTANVQLILIIMIISMCGILALVLLRNKIKEKK